MRGSLRAHMRCNEFGAQRRVETPRKCSVASGNLGVCSTQQTAALPSASTCSPFTLCREEPRSSSASQWSRLPLPPVPQNRPIQVLGVRLAQRVVQAQQRERVVHQAALRQVEEGRQFSYRLRPVGRRNQQPPCRMSGHLRNARVQQCREA